MCRNCGHEHWSHEPHTWKDGVGATPAGAKAAIDWKPRALAAEAKVKEFEEEREAQRAAIAQRVQKSRDKRKQNDGGKDQQLQTGKNDG